MTVTLVGSRVGIASKLGVGDETTKEPVPVVALVAFTWPGIKAVAEVAAIELIAKHSKNLIYFDSRSFVSGHRE